MTGTDLCVNKPVTVPVIFEPPCIYINKSETTDLFLCLFHDDSTFLIKVEYIPGLISGCRLHFQPTDSHTVWPEAHLKMLQMRIQIILS
jgi:hypothetical protein